MWICLNNANGNGENSNPGPLKTTTNSITKLPSGYIHDAFCMATEMCHPQKPTAE